MKKSSMSGKTRETGEECKVSPDSYAEVGIPNCPESGEDFIYCHTLIKTEGG